MTREEFYDLRIAPLVDQIIALCKEGEIPLHATFGLRSEDDPSLVCTTHLGEEWDGSPVWRLLRYAILCRGNLDILLTHILRDVGEQEHTSVYLRVLQTALRD